MPFLDVNVFCENDKFVTNIYRKETFTGVCTNFSTFIPLEHKFGLVYTLLHYCFCSVTDMSKFHFEIEKLKEILLSNRYSNKFIDKCILKFMNKLYTIGYIICKFSRLLINFWKQFEIFIDVYLITEAVASKSS